MDPSYARTSSDSQELSSTLFRASFNRLIEPQTSSDACWQWTGPVHSSGAARFLWKIDHGGRGKYVYAHRLSYWISTGEWPKYLRRLCGNKLCVRASHYWVKPSAKFKPKPRKAVRGRVKQLTDEEIRHVRLLVSLGSDEEGVGAGYGLSKRQTAAVAMGRVRIEAGGPIRASRHRGIRFYHEAHEAELRSLSMRPESVIPTAHSSLAVAMGTGSGVISNGERPFPSASYGRDTRRRRW